MFCLDRRCIGGYLIHTDFEKKSAWFQSDNICLSAYMLQFVPLEMKKLELGHMNHVV